MSLLALLFALAGSPPDQGFVMDFAQKLLMMRGAARKETMARSAKTLETIDLLYQAAVTPELWPDALDGLAAATGGVGTAMIPITPQSTAGLIVSPALAEANVEYEKEWWRHDTRVLRIFSRRLKGGVTCEAELFTDEEVARDPLRQEFLRAYGIGAFAAQLVTPLPNFVVAFSVQRSLKRGHFDKSDLETLGLLGRHAARALLVSTKLAAARGAGRMLADALTHFQCGAMIVDRNLSVVHANGAAEAMVGNGIALSAGQITASAPGTRRSFQRFLRAALVRDSAGEAEGPIALPRASGAKPLLAQAIPLAKELEQQSVASGRCVLVLLVDPERGAPAPAKALSLLGLTPAETRLAVLIGVGKSRRDAAELLGISLWTASDALKRIFAKLDISSQSALVRLMDRLEPLERDRGRDRA